MAKRLKWQIGHVAQLSNDNVYQHYWCVLQKHKTSSHITKTRVNLKKKVFFAKQCFFQIFSHGT